MGDVLVERFLERAGLTSADGARSVVEALRQMPYGRPEPQTEEEVISQWKGTCSTKHALLVRCLTELEPQSKPRLVHRVYRVTRETAEEQFGVGVASAVPIAGLVDVHTYALATFGERDIVLDVTFPGSPWDGTSDMPVAATTGQDFPAGPDPTSSKSALVLEHCDPAVREPFIAALSD